jgi:hypothetical protein
VEGPEEGMVEPCMGRSCETACLGLAALVAMALGGVARAESGSPEAFARNSETPAIPTPIVAEPASATAPSAPSLAPLAEGDLAAFQSVRPDAMPEEIIRDTHYFVSNELSPQHFRAPLQGLGGVGLGVGAEQNYLYAGWGRPELLVLVDFDQQIVDLHALYRVAFLEAATPEEFCALWTKPNRRRFAHLVESAYGDDPRWRAVLRVFRQARSSVEWRLGKLALHFAEAGVPSFATDADDYAYVRKLFQTDRVVRFRGDLTGRRTLADLGLRLKQQGRVVRWAYFSNAEQYFAYTPSFRRNIMQLPIDERSVLLRTRPHRQDYAYVVQPFGNFTAWLRVPHIRRVFAVVPHSVMKNSAGLVRVASEPPSRPEKKIRRARRAAGSDPGR